MSTCSDLFQEMNALALRYGVDECEKALNAVKLTAFQRRAGKAKRVEPTVWCMQDPYPLADECLLMRWCLTTDSIPEKFHLRVRGDPIGEHEESKEYMLFFGRWQELKTYSSFISSLCPVGSSSGCQRVQSRLHTLHLDEVGEETFNLIFEDKGVIALFEKVRITGIIYDVDKIEKLVVDEGVISSLKIHYERYDLDEVCCYDVDDKEGTRLAKMLGVNRLESFDVHCIPESPSFAHALIDSLNHHVQTFADGSILRDLDLQDTINYLLDLDAPDELFRDLLNIIGFLPNLISFGIHEPYDPNWFQILAGAIGNWKIRHFKVWRTCMLRVNHNEQYLGNLSHLFDSIKRSRHLKAFSICCIGFEIGTLEEVWTSHLFELALSSRGGLLEIEQIGYEVDTLLVSALVVEDCDRAVASKRHLRRFCVLWDQSQFRFDDMDDEDVFEYVRSLSWLVSKHLPYLYDIGTELRGCTDLETRIFESHDSALLSIWDEVLAQLEMNRVGMTLLQPEVLPTVPGGLWSRVLQRAIVCEEDETQLPWTGIYTMVRALVEGGHIGWGEARADTPWDGSPRLTKKRPRQY
jgi:hypothetical protein